MGKGWKVDHSVDDVDSSSMDGPPSFKIEGDTAVTAPLILETPEEKRLRKHSHWVVYATMFVMSIGFSIVLSGVWPYMQQLDKNLEKTALGWVVAANPFGQMIASPLLGIWGNKVGSIRGACICTIIFFIGGNVMYSMLYAFEDSGPNIAYYMMIVSRFIVGLSSGNVTLCRSYLAGSTTLKERTTGIAIIAACQAMGFVVGPGIQAVLTVVVPNKIETGIPGLVWDKYTSAGWVAAMLGFINLIIVMPCIFQEYNIAEKEREMTKETTESGEEIKLPKPDYVAIAGILVAFFFVLFIFVLLETLAEPFVTDQYAVSDDYAMVSVGIALVVGGLLSTTFYVLSAKLAKKYDERKLMIGLGMVPIVFGTFLYLPMGSTPIVMSECSPLEITTLMPTTIGPSTVAAEGFWNNFHLLSSKGDASPQAMNHPQYDFFYESLRSSEASENCTLGCPPIQTWCETVPMLPHWQLYTAYIITISGYPVAQGLAQSIFSKILGPTPQGLWMGILTGVGSMSRIAGPIFVSYVYTYNGTYWTFGTLAVGMMFSLIELLVLYKRLVPMKVPTRADLMNEGVDNLGMAEDSV